MMCDKVVTDIVSCRNVGDPDLKLLAHDGEDAYKFLLGGRQLELDTSTGECLNRKALDILMQGKPLVTRKGKQSKKRSRK
ncbi:hypothetical protein BBJ28_00005939 [Nothophytophthora sp. Chile5]|nr:hypothetical protein BBJ28_00005939 [Nothophytophthora sp. Chile5]